MLGRSGFSECKMSYTVHLFHAHKVALALADARAIEFSSLGLVENWSPDIIRLDRHYVRLGWRDIRRLPKCNVFKVCRSRTGVDR